MAGAFSSHEGEPLDEPVSAANPVPIRGGKFMNVIESSELFKVNARRQPDRRGAETPAPSARCEIHVLEPRWAAVVRFRAALDQLPRGFYHRYATLAASIIRSGQRPSGPPFAIFGKSDDNAVDVEAGLLVEQLGPVGE
jgi:hypothetical protein